MVLTMDFIEGNRSDDTFIIKDVSKKEDQILSSKFSFTNSKIFFTSFHFFFNLFCSFVFNLTAKSNFRAK